GAHVLVAAQRLPEACKRVLALEEQRPERASDLQAVAVDRVAAGPGHACDGLRRTPPPGVVGGGTQVGRTLVEVLHAGPPAEMQGAVVGVDRSVGRATGSAHAFVARTGRATQVEGGEAGRVAVPGPQVAHALLELAPIEQ